MAPPFANQAETESSLGIVESATSPVTLDRKKDIGALLSQTDSSYDVHEQISLKDAELRRQIADKIIGHFITVNILMFGLVLVIFLGEKDLQTPQTLQHYKQVISAEVILALIAGTVAQLGGIAFFITKWLFPTSTGQSS